MNLTHSYYTYMRRFKRFPSNDVELGAKRTNEAVPTIEIQKCKNSLFSRLMRDNWLKLLKKRKISQLFRIMHTSRQLPAVKLSGVSGVTNRSVDQNVIFHHLLTSALSRVTLFHWPLQPLIYNCFSPFHYHFDPNVSE